MRGQVNSGLILLSTMNFCNNFVSVHQFTTATKVLGLGCLQQSATLVPATSNHHYHNHSNVGNFTNNVHVSNAIQHNYCNSTSKILSPNVHIGTKPTTVGSKTLWIDNVNNHDDFMEINVPSQIQVNEQNRIVRTPEQSQTVQRFNEPTQIVQNSTRPVLIHHASTMTDFDSEDNYTGKRIHKDSSEDDSSKSSLEDYQFFQKLSCYTVCSNINVKSNAAAMAEYLERLQPSSIPLEIKEFLNNYGINVDPCRWKSKKFKEEDCVRGKPETHLSTNVDGSVLYSCTECKMTFAQKEIIEQHLSGMVVALVNYSTYSVKLVTLPQVKVHAENFIL